MNSPVTLWHHHRVAPYRLSMTPHLPDLLSKRLTRRNTALLPEAARRFETPAIHTSVEDNRCHDKFTGRVAICASSTIRGPHYHVPRNLPGGQRHRSLEDRLGATDHVDAMNRVDPSTSSDGIMAGAALVSEVVVSYLEIAAGNLKSIGTLIGAGELFGPPALARAVMETCARVFWVLGNEMDPAAILARAYLEEFDSCEREQSAAKRLGGGTSAPEYGVAPAPFEFRHHLVTLPRWQVLNVSHTRSRFRRIVNAAVVVKDVAPHWST